MKKQAKTPKWSPVRPIKPKDHFVSSDYANCPQFIPSYNKEKENMFLLMAHDYAKMWQLENSSAVTKRFEFAGEENERLCRRYVLRALQNKRKIAEIKPRFIMKRFQNIPSRVRQYIMFPRDGSLVKQQPPGTLSLNEREDGRSKQAPSKLACANDSADLLLEKRSLHSEQEVCSNTTQVTLSPELMRCRSEMDLVSPSPAVTNLLEQASSKSKGSKMSETSTATKHYHVAFDGSNFHIRGMPPGHKHSLKINATPIN